MMTRLRDRAHDVLVARAKDVAIGAVVGLAIGVLAGAACGIHAQEPPEPRIDGAVACERGAGCTGRPQLLAGIAETAVEAGADPQDVLGALNTLADAGIETNARSYLIADGKLPAPVLPPPAALGCGWPICGPLGQRIFCIEGIESSHGRFMFNATPWRGEHAQGFLGWLPSTARRWGVAIGDRASEWGGAARMLRAGAGAQFFGVASGRC